MPSYEFVTVDVFTDVRFGGNPLAVLPNAQGLTAEQMQAIAREFNLSETSFVLPPADPAHTVRVRIFTPAAELPFAGHPNVGTGFVLAGRNKSADAMVFEEIAGLVTVRVQRAPDGAPIAAEIDAPQSLTVGDDVSPGTLASCVGLDASDVWQDTHQPLIASVGIPFVLAELTTREALARAQPDLLAFRAAASEHPATGDHFSIMLYVRDEADPARLHARMFGPLLGVPEDPATGSAAAALAALLTSLAPGADVELSFDIAQGADMGRPSRIIASARKSAEAGVYASVAGGCVPVTQGMIEV